MGTDIFVTSTSAITSLSSRVLVGSFIAIACLLLFTSLTKKNKQLTNWFFLLFVAIIVFSSSILIITAMANINNGDNKLFMDKVLFL